MINILLAILMNNWNED